MSEHNPGLDSALKYDFDKRLLPEGERERREEYLRTEIGLSEEKIKQMKEFQDSLVSIDQMKGKIEGLKERGFSDPLKMIESLPQILSLGFDNIDNKISGLKDRGFSNPHKMIESLPTILGYAFDNIDNKISGLKDRGFSNPNKMIESLPAILSYAFDSIDSKISGLKDRGFSKPHKMIESSPSILGLGFDNIDNKISGLKDRGFSNPHKMIESLPAILGYAFDSIDNKISGLKDRGFTNPNKMIESLPPILGLGFDNIDNKILGLKDRSFSNPNKMIESLPSILNLGFDNIDKRIKLLNFLNNNYQLKLNPISTIENNPAIFGTKFEKLIVITRIIKEYQPTVDEVQKKISTLYAINLESLLLSYSERKAGDNIYDLTRKAAYIQKEKIDKEIKRKLIKDFFDKHPESYKIYRDYLRGYPEK